MNNFAANLSGHFSQKRLPEDGAVDRAGAEMLNGDLIGKMTLR
jgi:hypothetical protein